MPQKTNLVYFLCGIINLGYCYECGKVAWAVGVVKNRGGGGISIKNKLLKMMLLLRYSATYRDGNG